MDFDAGFHSLIVAVSWYGRVPYSSSIVQLETQVQNHELAVSSATNTQTQFSAHIPTLRSRPIAWCISLPPASSPTDMYFFPDWSVKESENAVALPGLIFNFSSRKCKTIKAPLAPKYCGHAVTMGDHIYLMAPPQKNGYAPNPRFERYDTLKQSWEKREAFPLGARAGLVLGTAVLDDNILFHMNLHKMWVYNVVRDKWYPVKVEHELCYSIVGAALILEGRIYALPEHCCSVVVLTLESQDTEDGLVFKCHLLKEYVVPGMGEIKYDCWDAHRWNRHLIHLGEDNFCVLRSSTKNDVDNQFIQVTNIKVREEKSFVTNICVHEFQIPSGGYQFIVTHCFSMPKCKTTALKQGKGYPEPVAEIVTLPPELDKYSSRTIIIDEQGGSVSQSSQSRDHADTTPEVQEDVPKKSSAPVVAAKSNAPSKGSRHPSLSYVKPYATKASTLGDGATCGRSSADEKGHSIYVRNLRLDANCAQLAKVLKKFGPLKSLGIRIESNNMSMCCIADVEFESASSKENAIKASPIKIGGCLAVIKEKRGTGRSQGDSNSLSVGCSSSSAQNKFKNHGEDSQCKSTSGGQSVEKVFGGCRPLRPKNHGEDSQSKTTSGGHNVEKVCGIRRPLRPKNHGEDSEFKTSSSVHNVEKVWGRHQPHRPKRGWK